MDAASRLRSRGRTSTAPPPYSIPSIKLENASKHIAKNRAAVGQAKSTEVLVPAYGTVREFRCTHGDDHQRAV